MWKRKENWTSQTLYVLPIGWPVRVGPEWAWQGVIAGVWIEEGGPRYSVIWWEGRNRRKETLEAGEVKPEDGAGRLQVTMGFSADRK